MLNIENDLLTLKGKFRRQGSLKQPFIRMDTAPENMQVITLRINSELLQALDFTLTNPRRRSALLETLIINYLINSDRVQLLNERPREIAGIKNLDSKE